jgi:hypothetical protein
MNEAFEHGITTILAGLRAAAPRRTARRRRVAHEDRKRT